ncbi:MAG: dTDP-glucose 4,6-dehydratase [Candidatus Aenigmatarchaeota archaeon]
MKRVLVTGGAGFIGSNFVRYLINKYPKIEILVLDKLTYAGNMNNLIDVRKKIKFFKGDICDKKLVERVSKNCDYIFNFAAETHVDRSINNPEIFVKTNIVGTNTLLEVARRIKNLEKYVQISTDEVYGSKKKGSFKESDRLDPSSPYSASKAGSDLICLSYYKTYNLPIVITRSSNNYGPFQFPEKLIPVMIINAIKNKPMPIYGDGKNVRDWLFVDDNCEAIDFVSKNGKNGEIYNIASGFKKTNIEIVKKILKILNKPESLIKFVEDRPGHDFRYSLNCQKIRKMGWKPKINFDDGLERTIEWYINNKWWWESLIRANT